MRHKIIYISGLGHGGSTFTDLILSSNLDAVSLGELQNPKLLESFRLNKDCSCGNSVDSCLFWKGFLSEVNTTEKVNLTKVVEHFENIYSGRTMIDSSKYNKYMFEWWNLSNKRSDVDLTVLHVIRDFRGWINSQSIKTDRILFKSFLFGSYYWMVRNIRTIKWLKSNKVKHSLVLYDDLVLNASYLNTILTTINTDQSTKLSTSTPIHHILKGNRMRHKFVKDRLIRYNYSWFYSVKLFLVMPLILPVFLYYVWLRKVILSNNIG